MSNIVEKLLKVNKELEERISSQYSDHMSSSAFIRLVRRLEIKNRIYSYPRSCILLTPPDTYMCCFRFVDVDDPVIPLDMDVIYTKGKDDPVLLAYKQAYFEPSLKSSKKGMETYE